jgi:hypothetical protein
VCEGVVFFLFEIETLKEIKTMTNPVQKEIRGGNTEVIFCTDCNAWDHVGGRIRHSGRCSFPQAQFEEVAEPKTVEVQKFDKDARGNGLTSDELLSNVRRGHLSMSDAMNTDF